jgi:uncharacterized membrane protein HdeD (DUF308 family)
MSQADDALLAGTTPTEREAIKQLASFWWLWLVFGILWIIVALVVLQFSESSFALIGVMIGAMFIGAGVQYMALSTLAPKWRWVWALLGALLIIWGVVAIFNPVQTFNEFADILGFIFLLVAFIWFVQAFSERDHNDLWWLGLVSGTLMLVIAFIAAGSDVNVKANLLVLFVGLWALMSGIVDLVRAFQLHHVGEKLE